MNRQLSIHAKLWLPISAACATALAPAAAAAQTPPPSGVLESLKGVTVPEPAQLANFVKNRQQAIVLGKALFWDQAIGSDGRTACATCHFHAGADRRTKNQLSPDLLRADGSALGNLFNKPFSPDASSRTLSGGAGGPNYTLNARDFPFHVLADPLDRNSPVVFDTDDVASSAGVFGKIYVGPLNKRKDSCTPSSDPVFSIAGVQTRRVEPRNTPTVINAVFNLRNFWDGRASWVFNGANPFGNQDPDARIYETINGVPTAVRVALENASAASQAAGPPGSAFEMSCSGRMFPDIARRILKLRALAKQDVSPSDGVLGPYAADSGLTVNYQQLIRAAFWDKYWSSPLSVSLNGAPYSQIEANFALFFGLAIQMYEATLISDDAPLDRYLGNATIPGDPSALGADARHGMELFTGKAGCVACHTGPQLTAAGTPSLREIQSTGIIELMRMGDQQLALYDMGFYNIGVRPTVEDLGIGGKSPFGVPLSFTRQYLSQLGGAPAVDPLVVNFCAAADAEPGCTPVTDPGFRAAVDGAFKVPGLRNVELTGPYFHNGGAKNLAEVVAFYNRGGNRRGPDGNDTTGAGTSGTNLDPDIEPRNLTADEQAALVAFLTALTDERVRWERAPFDHPAIELPSGHHGNEFSVKLNASGVAADVMLQIPAVGAAGRGADLGPLKPFEQYLAQ